MRNRSLQMSKQGRYRRGFRLLLTSLLLLGLCGSVWAQSAYQLEVAVADKSESEQKQAYQVAMRRVLLNNSPDKTLLNRDDVRSGINDAESYVESFSYRSPEPGTVISRSTPITDLVRRTGEATQLMLVAFNPARIQDLIRRQNNDEQDQAEPVSALANVRSALAWILVQDGRSDVLVGGDVGDSVMQRAREVAGGSGISLSFPNGDQADIDALTADQLRARDTKSIQNAAQRYSIPVTITAYLARKRSRGWIGLWSKVAGDEVEYQEFEADTLDDMISVGFSWLQPGAAGASSEYEYGGAAQAHTEGLVWVSSVSATADYAKVMSFLNSIDSVVTVFPKEIAAGGTLFAVMPRSALNAVAAGAASLGWLRRASPPAGGGLSAQAELAFDFLR